MHERFWCLDALSISWTGGTEQRVCGTLLEVWSSGGVIQTEEPIAKGETFTISVHGAQFEARVENTSVTNTDATWNSGWPVRGSR